MSLAVTQNPVFGNYHADSDYLAGICPGCEFLFLNIREEKVSIPLLKRCLRKDHFDLLSPIGFQPHIQQAAWPALLDALREELFTLGAVSLYILCKNDLSGLAPPRGTDLTRSRQNYVIDLQLSYDQWLMQQKSDSRQRLRKALDTTRYELVETTLSNEYIVNYRRIAEEKNFPPRYVYAEADLKKIAAATNITYLELRDDREFIAGGLFGCDRADVDYLFGANSPRYTDAIRLLINEARQYFKIRAFDWLCLGGGIQENDSLAVFKQRMGTLRQSCSAIRVVVNIDQAEQLMGSTYSTDWFNGYFPPYVKVTAC